MFRPGPLSPATLEVQEKEDSSISSHYFFAVWLQNCSEVNKRPDCKHFFFVMEGKFEEEKIATIFLPYPDLAF